MSKKFEPGTVPSLPPDFASCAFAPPSGMRRDASFCRPTPPRQNVATSMCWPSKTTVSLLRSPFSKRASPERGRPANSADAAFLDADKGSYPLYLQECLRIVRPGGMILADNAFAFGQLLDPNANDREVPAVRAFNEVMAKEPRLHSVIVPIGDGLWVGVKR